MAGNLIRAADDRNLVDKTFHQDVAEAVGGWYRMKP
jgi:hypothetical protein